MTTVTCNTNSLPPRRFYVYTHTLNCNAVIYGKVYPAGTIVYVGSGQRHRFATMNGRKVEHRNIWESLEKKIVVAGLTADEKIQVEQEYISIHSPVLNSRKTVSKVKPINYQQVSGLFLVDESSPSGLVWKVDRFCKKRLIAKAGDPVGYLNKLGYWVTSIQSRKYQVHRLVWTLSNRQDCPVDFQIDHLNRISSDNCPSNLVLVTATSNLQNRGTIKGECKGVYWSPRDSAWVATYYENGLPKSKYFTVRKIYPYTEFPVAKELAKQDAIVWRSQVIRDLYHNASDLNLDNKA